jgi:uncharacterized protein (TIGR02266 family)
VQENRRHRRVGCRLRCWCEGEKVTLYARVLNLSEGGVFLRTSTPLAEGSAATIRLGGKQGFEVTARVMWCRLEGQVGPPGLGLQFERVDDPAREAIRRAMATEQEHGSPNCG